MTRKTLLEAIRTKIRAITWTGGSTPIFATDSVVISVAPTPAILSRVSPIAIIVPGAMSPDPEHGEEPELLVVSFDVRIVVVNANDDIGESVLMGSGRSAGSTRSPGAGLLQIEEELLPVMSYLDADDGITIIHKATGTPQPILDEDTGYILWCDYGFEATI